jgi:hypothetical protein
MKAAKNEIAGQLVREMAAGVRYDANMAFNGLCQQVIRELRADEKVATIRSGGEFSTVGAVALLQKIPRVSGYLRAIQRAPEARSVIDAGTGPSALLAVAAKVYHPSSQVLAYESNEKSVMCARRVIQLLGFSDDEIIVTHADVLNEGILPGKADLSITETFGQGLRIENGPKIAHKLGQVAGHLIPGKVQLFITDNNPDIPWDWQVSHIIDLRDQNTHVEGTFRSAYSGFREIYVRTDFLAEDESDIVSGLHADDITDPMFIGSITAPSMRSLISFRYETGPINPNRQPELSISA